MIEIEIPLEPVSWLAHRGYGKKAFNPRYKEREAFQWYIRQQYKEKPLDGPVSVSYHFFFNIPKCTSKRNKLLMGQGIYYHIVRPDCSNCMKFTEDCLKNILIVDDNQVVECYGYKYYSDYPRVEIKIQRMPYATQEGKEQS